MAATISSLYADGVYRFNQAADYEYDVEDFLVKRAEAAHTVEPSARIAAYQAAVDLYRGSFLPSFAGSWVIVERERCTVFLPTSAWNSPLSISYPIKQAWA